MTTEMLVKVASFKLSGGTVSSFILPQTVGVGNLHFCVYDLAYHFYT